MLKHLKFNKSTTAILFSVILFFISLSVFIWHSRDGIVVGGDDSLLYYIFPKEYKNNFVKNIILGTANGAYSQYSGNFYIYPFVKLLEILKYVINSNKLSILLFSLNIALGFFFFYKFLGEFFEDKNKCNLEKIIVSALYAYSIYNYITIERSKLFAIFFVSFLPLISFLITKFINSKEIKYLLIVVLVASFMSILIMSTPWLLAFLIIFFPIIFSKLRITDTRIVIKKCLLAIPIFLLLNFYWIFNFSMAIFSGGQSYSDIFKNDFKKGNENTIIAVNWNNQIEDAFLYIWNPHLQENFGWETYSFFTGWFLRFQYINLIFLVVILVGIFLSISNNKKIKEFPFILLAWLMGLYFMTVNVLGRFGITLFLKFNEFIPGFTMLRNNYDKFSPAYAFVYSLMLYACISIIKKSKILNFKIYKLTLFILSFAVVFNIIPSLIGVYEKIPVHATENIYSKILSLDSDFLDFSSQLTSFSDKKIVWLPLNITTYNFIPDDSLKDHYYVGVSPTLFLSGVNDYTGMMSFNSDDAVKISQAIEKNSTTDLGQILQKNGINYIALNKTIPEEIYQSYLFDKDLLAKQDNQFIESLLGKQVINVNDKYLLYEINPEFHSEQVEASGNCMVDDYSFTDHESVLVRVSYSPGQHCVLNFKEPFHKFWYIKNGTEKVFSQNSQDGKNSFAFIPQTDQLEIRFLMRDYYYLFIAISAVSAIVVIIWLIALLIKERK